jgi:hypothetical protein
MLISEGLQYHIDNNISLCNSIYREGSQGYLDLICEARKLYNLGHISLHEEDLDLIDSDLGTIGIYEGRKVMLDYPMDSEADEIFEAEYRGRKVKLNKPKRGGKKKFYVYVRDPKTKNVKKVSFGDTTGLSIKTKDPKRRKAFRDRHNCDNPGPKTKARYWSCRMWSGPNAIKNMLGK